MNLTDVVEANDDDDDDDDESYDDWQPAKLWLRFNWQLVVNLGQLNRQPELWGYFAASFELSFCQYMLVMRWKWLLWALFCNQFGANLEFQSCHHFLLAFAPKKFQSCHGLFFAFTLKIWWRSELDPRAVIAYFFCSCTNCHQLWCEGKIDDSFGFTLVNFFSSKLSLPISLALCTNFHQLWREGKIDDSFGFMIFSFFKPVIPYFLAMHKLSSALVWNEN